MSNELTRATITLVTPPALEPVPLQDMKDFLYVDFSADDKLIMRLIRTARMAVETYTRRALLTQEWLYAIDYFPGYELLYTARGYPSLLLPKPPFQAVQSIQYVDVFGDVQPLPEQTDYGKDSSLFYGYQLDPGNETQPARLTPPWARPFPPTRRVPRAVQVDFTCGYCDAAYVSIAANALNAITGYTFPQSDNGATIYIPDAGPTAGSSPAVGQLLTAVLAVDAQGNGTITPAASVSVTDSLAFIRGYVPDEMLLAIKLHVAHFYRRRGDDAPARAVGGDEYPDGWQTLLDPWINRIA
jgi:uncharacterized phiE125 gp8 family phage protein